MSQELVMEFQHLGKTLTQCLETLEPLFVAQAAGVWLPAENAMVTQERDIADNLPSITYMPPSNPFAEVLTSHHGTVILRDVADLNGYQGELGSDVQALWLIPLQPVEIGTLVLASAKPDAFEGATSAAHKALIRQTVATVMEALDYIDLQRHYDQVDEAHQKAEDRAAQRFQEAKELRQKSEDLQAQIERVYELESIGKSIHLLHDQDKIIAEVAQAIVSDMHLERGLVLWFDPAASTLSCLAYTSQRGDESTGWSLSPTASFLDMAIQQRGPLFIADTMAQLDPQDEFWKRFPVTSLVTHPLTISGKLAGLIVAGAQFPYSKLGPEDVETISFLASQAEQALENARLYHELRHINVSLERRIQARTAELATVNEISQAVNSTLDLNQVLNQVMSTLSDSFEVERASLLLLNETSSNLDFAMNLGGDLKTLQNFPLTLGKGIAGWVAQTGEIAIVNDVEQDPRFFPDVSKSMDFHVASILCVPLQIKGRAIGVIELLNKLDGEFNDQDAHRLLTLVPPIAIAIENAQLFGAIQRQAAERLALYQVGQRLRSLRSWVETQDQVFATVLEMISNSTQRYPLIGLYATQDGISLQASYGYPHLGDPSAQLVQQLMNTEQARLIVPIAGSAYLPLDERSVSAAIVPLTDWQGKKVGALVIESFDALETSDLELLQAFADQIAVALDNVSLYEELEHANEHLIELNDARIQFVSSVSHELRTPMTSIKGYTDMLISGMTGELSEPQRRFLSIIQSNANRMGILVNDLLEISRIEAGRIRLDPKAVSVNETVFDTTTGLQAQMVTKRLTYETSIPAALPLVWVDRDRLIQILTNLLGNAVKYTLEGGSITVSAHRLQATNKGTGFVQVDVADTGIGIAADEQNKVFERFFRADHDVVRQQIGTGLGLSIVQGLVELHGGEIWFESALGTGTTFSFTLPVATEEQIASTASE